MTTSNGRSTESRRSGRSVGQWLLGLLIVLALVASILMVFSDQLSVTGSLAVIAALWAAVIGAILVTKFRRQAETAESKSRDLRLVYELQLEREIAARRQYELDVETTIRKELSDESNSEISELREQVMSLRASLEALLGESLPDHRAALPSEKLRELASGIDRPDEGYKPFRADDSALAAQDFAATAPAADSGRHIPADVDPNELTEVIPIITDDPLSGRIATAVPEDETSDQVEDAVIAETPGADTPAYVEDNPTDQWATESPAAVEEEPVAESPEPVVAEVVEAEPVEADTVVGDQTPQAEAADQPTAETVEEAETAEAPADTAAAETDEGEHGRHETAEEQGVDPNAYGGRRRRRGGDDGESAHSAGLPVSELLSQLRQSGAPGGGRRRRED
ncbi:DUF6779 domain-containing protein [Gordonia sp. CPCC 206044]|uniref:DUF6779 domain-containing protein n=1 Tax=Gordonia sp. CPCC 206044 TaxID=3140793 RepID=UPI003AF35234